MTTVLVTGGMGFIGSHTVDLLVKRGHEVVVLDNLERQVHRGRKPDYLNPDATYIIGDIRFRKHWLRALKNVGAVIHLAGSVGIGQSFWEAKKYADVNVGGTAMLYEILTKEPSIRGHIDKVVVAASKSSYGEGVYQCPDHETFHPEQRPASQLKKGEWEVMCPRCGKNATPLGIREDTPMQSLNPYSITKHAVERLAMGFSSALGIDTVALRYFNVYGPRQSLNNPYTGVMAIFLSRLQSGHQPFLFEDGGQLRDYIYVEDVAKVNVTALTKGSGSINVGTGKPTSLKGVVSILDDALGSNIKPVISGEFRPGDNRHDFANLDLFEETFGNTSFTPMSSGIKDLVKWSATAPIHDMFEKEERERKRFLPT
jgi:dTDP-L-rhamnose 4-epimerase